MRVSFGIRYNEVLSRVQQMGQHWASQLCCPKARAEYSFLGALARTHCGVQVSKQSWWSWDMHCKFNNSSSLLAWAWEEELWDQVPAHLIPFGLSYLVTLWLHQESWDWSLGFNSYAPDWIYPFSGMYDTGSSRGQFWEIGEKCSYKLYTKAQDCSWHLENWVEIYSSFCDKKSPALQITGILLSSNCLWVKTAEYNQCLSGEGKEEKNKGYGERWAKSNEILMICYLQDALPRGDVGSMGRQLEKLGECWRKSAHSSPVPTWMLGRVLIWVRSELFQG